MSDFEIAAASIVDVATIGGARTRTQWHILREMRNTGEIVAARLDGRAIALGCFYPLPDQPEHAETCFMVTPEAAPYMLKIVRAMRLTIDASPYRVFVAICQTQEGARIARALGFTYEADSELGEVWAYAAIRGRRRRSELE